MQKVYDALEGLDEAGRRRTLAWAADRLDLGAGGPSQPLLNGKKVEAESTGFDDVAELTHAAQPPNGTAYALVAAYWLQVIEEKDGWGGGELNSLLKNLGHGLSNVTTTMNSLIKRKPALVMQTGKSGRSAQAKKTYKLTTSGISEVKQMIVASSSGSSDD